MSPRPVSVGNLVATARETMQRSGLGPPIRTAVSVLHTPLWRRRGSPPPAPPHLKRHIVSGYVERSGLRTFVETGTYRGDTIAKIRPLVTRTVSIELDPTLYRYAKRRFRRHSSVELLEGDSAHVLPSVVASLAEPAVFWLDGHYSGGPTADPGASPILAELAVILSSDLPHVVLVDDARLFDGTDGYPTLDTITSSVDASGSGRTCHVEDDIVRIQPSMTR